MFHDAHNHLQDEWLDPYRDKVIADLEKIGIGGAIVNGTTEVDWAAVETLAAQHPWAIPSYGLHPWYVRERTPDWRRNLLNQLDKRPCGVGEIGLDRWIPDYDFEDQKAAFRWQLAIAAERNLPVTIHCLKAWGALEEILRNEAVPDCGFLLHAYGGPREMIDSFVKLGAYFSFPGYFLHERKSAQREVFRIVPIDRLLVETDAPALPLPDEKVEFPLPSSPTNQPLNHPANIATIQRALAEIRGVTPESLAKSVTANFLRLFGRSGGPHGLV
ncbi:MAG TPA: TatD family hydrolase [Chthoniobacterales bacterium]